MQVYNLISKRSGRPDANQFAIICNDGTISLDEYYWNYSRTTTKYLCQFLEMNSGQIKANVDAGIFKMIDMNNASTYNKMYNL